MSSFGSPNRYLPQKSALQRSSKKQFVTQAAHRSVKTGSQRESYAKSRKQYNYDGYRQISTQQDIHPNILSITYFKDDNFCYKSFYERENKHRGKRAFFKGIIKQIKTLFGGRQLKFGHRKLKKFSTKVPTVTYRKVVRKTGLPVPTNQGSYLI